MTLGHSGYQQIRMHGLGDVLREHRRSRPAMTAVVDGDIRLSWPDLDSRVNQLAQLMLADKLGEGSRILWLGQNSFRLLECILAAAKIGAMVCPINWRMSATEITAVIEDFTPHFIIWQQQDIGDTAKQARANTSHSCRWIAHDDTAAEGYEALLAAQADIDPNLAIHSDCAVVAMYTAAFDGKPNAAILSQSAMLYQSLMIAYGYSISDESSNLNSGPLFHLGTMLSTLATFSFGGKNVFIARVDAEEMLNLIAAEKITNAFVAQPTMLQIRELNKDGKYDTSSLWSSPDAPEWSSGFTVKLR